MRPHKLQIRSVSQLVAWHANSLCTTLIRLANSFVPYPLQILSLKLELGISANLRLLLRSEARPQQPELPPFALH
jgi:hypothetical protein